MATKGKVSPSPKEKKVVSSSSQARRTNGGPQQQRKSPSTSKHTSPVKRRQDSSTSSSSDNRPIPNYLKPTICSGGPDPSSPSPPPPDNNKLRRNDTISSSSSSAITTGKPNITRRKSFDRPLLPTTPSSQSQKTRISPTPKERSFRSSSFTSRSPVPLPDTRLSLKSPNKGSPNYLQGRTATTAGGASAKKKSEETGGATTKEHDIIIITSTNDLPDAGDEKLNLDHQLQDDHPNSSSPTKTDHQQVLDDDPNSTVIINSSAVVVVDDDRRDVINVVEQKQEEETAEVAGSHEVDDEEVKVVGSSSMGGVYVLLKRIMISGVVHDIRHLQGMLRNLTGNMTFQEAYDATGRILGITVCSPRKHEPPRCLNYLTSPHVLIWSAVTASCAFPGLFEAQELMAKTRNGELVPYHPPFHLGPEEGGSPANGRRWRDGSLQADLPMIHLKELFNVNHFIVSQANPHIAPLLRLKEYVRSCGGNFAAKLALLAEMEVKHRSSQLLELGFPFGKLFAQDWEGDVTIVMSATLMQYLKIIQNPSESDIRKAAEQARRCTFEKLSAIKANCGIEVALDDCVSVLHHMRRLKRSAARAAAAASASQGLAATTNTSRFSAYKRRIPSWNCLARELSAGSLDEEPLVATRNLQNQQNSRDGSDSDSERGVDHNSWTRSGGPLMRTTSADEFVEFVQNLGGGGDSNSRSQFIRRETLNEGGGSSKEVCVPGNNNSDGSSSRRTSDSAEFDQRVGSRIMVTEGDILQTEMIQNGIVLNVVKKEALTPSNNDPNDSSDHTSTYASEVAECMQLECPDGDLDTSSTSEGSDIDDRDQDQHC